jgi:hypothetical protein
VRALLKVAQESVLAFAIGAIHQEIHERPQIVVATTRDRAFVRGGAGLFRPVERARLPLQCLQNTTPARAVPLPCLT